MARDETRDILVNSHGIALKWRGGEYLSGTAWERYVTHSDMASLESENAELRKRLSDTETERDFWRKKHQDDNEGLMFQLGRNLEFAQSAAFRHGATEPHATIKCIQIIDEHAESLRCQLADRDATIAQLKTLPGDEAVMSCAKALLREADEHTSRARGESREHHERVTTHLMNAVSFLGRFERQLTDREDAIRRLQEELNELRSENAELRRRLELYNDNWDDPKKRAKP